ncbi:MAG: gamma-glutamyl-gamma-aminobutyrate hydrolase family protein [Clostridia bacterium]|nr:gamma-glutamyl-gamma-aminobutyrate hydrolase family protein [Clostridia bacterium]
MSVILIFGQELELLKPIIGITCDYDWEAKIFKLHSGYVEGISRAGGLPLIIPPISACAVSESISNILSQIQALLLTGGQDVHPRYFGEEPHTAIGRVNPQRDELELPLCLAAVQAGMPVLGICRGIQLINVALGGDIYQDLKTQFEGRDLICHSQSAPTWTEFHKISIHEGSRLHHIFGVNQVYTNSFHHQAVRTLAPGLEFAASAADGVIEAVESKSHSFLVGVQWHPERMLEDSHMLGLFKAFVEAAGVQKT